MKKPETKFKEKIRPLLQALPNSFWFKTQLAALRGIPDFIGCINGKFIALELKKDIRAKVDSLQKYTLHQVALAGGLSFVVSPENWPQIYRQWLIPLSAGKHSALIAHKAFQDSLSNP